MGDFRYAPVDTSYGQLEWKLVEYPNGDRYQGQCKKGTQVKHGKGIKIFECGRCYEGNWKKGARHGQGRDILSDGDYYDGDFKNGKYHGKGVLTFGNGIKFDGYFKDGKQEGKGVLT